MRIEVHLTPERLAADLRRDVAQALTGSPKSISPRWFYDERGCDLFDAITQLPEYYPTRHERGLLAQHAVDIAAHTDAKTLIEFGSGTSEKTRILLAALSARRTLERFVPFDVSEPTLRAAGEAIEREFPRVSVEAIVGDFERHLEHVPAGANRLLAFLGSTIGNLDPNERRSFFAAARGLLGRDEWFLLGVDLVKDVETLEAAYNDPAGVTAEFNRNVLHVINRELGADFCPERFEHVARWVPDESRIEMALRAPADEVVHVPALEMSATFSAGEEMRTEISTKFTEGGIKAELEAAGFDPRAWITDGAVGLVLATPKR